MNGEEQLADLVEEEAPPAPAEEPFQFGTLTPEVSFALREVQPPSECYISPDDRLLVEAWNVLAGVALVVNARILKPDGTLIQNTWSYIPTSAGALNAWQQGLAEGFLLTLSVDSGQAPAGACYVRVRLLRGAMPGLYPVSQTLAAGYVVRGSTLSWPYPRFVGPCEGPGRVRVIVGTDPAAGSQISETVPTGVRWRLLILRAQLTTSGIVGDRLVFLRIYSGVQVVWTSVPVFLQGASSTWAYHWFIGAEARSLAGAQVCQDALPGEITLPAGFVMDTITSGMLAGDDWSAPNLYVEEWVEP